MPAILIRMIAAEGRHLHAIYQHHAELRAHQLRRAETSCEQLIRTWHRLRYRNPSVRVPTPGRAHSRPPARPGSHVREASWRRFNGSRDDPHDHRRIEAGPSRLNIGRVARSDGHSEVSQIHHEHRARSWWRPPWLSPSSASGAALRSFLPIWRRPLITPAALPRPPSVRRAMVRPGRDAVQLRGALRVHGKLQHVRTRRRVHRGAETAWVRSWRGCRYHR